VNEAYARKPHLPLSTLLEALNFLGPKPVIHSVHL
jgi:hypothetical protein